MKEHTRKRVTPFVTAAALLGGAGVSKAPEATMSLRLSATAIPDAVRQDYLDQLAEIKAKSQEAIEHGLVQTLDINADLNYFALLTATKKYIERNQADWGLNSLTAAMLNRPQVPEGSAKQEDTLLPLFVKLQDQMFGDLRAKNPLRETSASR